MSLILAFETSCDDTSVALYDTHTGLIKCITDNHLSTHIKTGGIIPELASRDHLNRIVSIIDELFKQTNLELSQIKAIAYTRGPGLLGALLIGASFAYTLGWSLKIKTIGVNHMEGHIFSVMLDIIKPNYPFISLIISGGHTMLIQVMEFGKYKILGRTHDDAVGEAYDKTARLLGLDYPGGAKLEKLAKKAKTFDITFPKPMIDVDTCDFSFSGLKTSVRRYLELMQNNGEDIESRKADIAYAFQVAVAETLKRKCELALVETNIRDLVVVGGVSANFFIRERLSSLSSSLSVRTFFPKKEFCTDNAAMIGYVGSEMLKKGIFDNYPDPNCYVDPNLALRTI